MRSKITEKQKGRYLAWFLCASVATAAVAAASMFSTHECLNAVHAAWPVLASWLPVIFLLVGVLLSNADKNIHRVLSATGRMQLLINDIKHAICAILLATIVLFILDMSTWPHEYLVMIGVWLLVFSVGLCTFVARAMLKIATEVYDGIGEKIKKEAKDKSDSFNHGEEILVDPERLPD